MLRGCILSRSGHPRNIRGGLRRNGASRSQIRAVSRCISFLLSRRSGTVYKNFPISFSQSVAGQRGIKGVNAPRPKHNCFVIIFLIWRQILFIISMAVETQSLWYPNVTPKSLTIPPVFQFVRLFLRTYQDH